MSGLYPRRPTLALAVALALVAPACGGGSESSPAAKTGGEKHGVSFEDTRREVCSLAGGSVRIVVSVPDGFALARAPESCMVAEEHGKIPSFVTISAIAVDDAGPEQKLGEPGGVLAWVEATGVLGEGVSQVGEGRTELLGADVGFVRVVGEPQGLGVRREVALMSTRQASHHVVVMAVYPPGDDAARERTMSLLEGIGAE
ncbi:MAG: hypothetical protein ACOCUS_05615 [Polyangiales bacterium]